MSKTILKDIQLHPLTKERSAVSADVVSDDKAIKLTVKGNAIPRIEITLGVERDGSVTLNIRPSNRAVDAKIIRLFSAATHRG